MECDLFFTLGAVPSSRCVMPGKNVNLLRIDVQLGRKLTSSRPARRSSSGKTPNFLASVSNTACISFSFSGFFAARSSACEKSFEMSYSSHLSFLNGTLPPVSQGTL